MMGAAMQRLPLTQGDPHGCAAEHTALLRMWGRLQSELSVRCQAHADALATLEAEVLRLRADLLLARTAVCWGLAAGALIPPPRQRRRAAQPATPWVAPSEAEEVLCRTACEGHAHHWLDDDNGCARTGQPCHQLTRPA